MLNVILHSPCKWVHLPICCYHYLLIIPVAKYVYCSMELKEKGHRLKLPLTHNHFHPLKRRENSQDSLLKGLFGFDFAIVVVDYSIKSLGQM